MLIGTMVDGIVVLTTGVIMVILQLTRMRQIQVRAHPTVVVAIGGVIIGVMRVMAIQHLISMRRLIKAPVLLIVEMVICIHQTEDFSPMVHLMLQQPHPGKIYC